MPAPITTAKRKPNPWETEEGLNRNSEQGNGVVLTEQQIHTQKQETFELWQKFLTPEKLQVEYVKGEFEQNGAVEKQETKAVFTEFKVEIGGKTGLRLEREPEPPQAEPHKLKTESKTQTIKEALKETGTNFAKASFKEGKDFVGSIISLFKEYIFFKMPKNEKKSPEQQKKDEEVKRNKWNFVESMKRFANFLNPNFLKVRRERAQNVNKQLGAKGARNLSYEGVLDSAGQILETVSIDLEKVNSKKEEEQIRQEKQAQLFMATGSKKKGPKVVFDLNKSHQANSVTNLRG